MARRPTSIPPAKWAHLRPVQQAPANLSDLARRLNTYNLTELLTLNALFSAADAPLDEKVPPFNSLLNFALRRLFVLSILESKAADYKDKMPTPSMIQSYWQELGKVEKLEIDDDRDTLYSIALPIASNQLRFQNLTVVARAQQVYALLIASQPHGSKYLNFNEKFHQYHGLSIVDMLRFLINLEKFVLDSEKVVDNVMAVHEGTPAPAVWHFLVEESREWRRTHQILTSVRMADAFNMELAVVEAAVACLSAPIQTLREWHEQHRSLALPGLPITAPFALERYPLVQLPNGGLVLPEQTALPVAVSQTVMTLLKEAIAPSENGAFDKTRGQVLETYLYGLLQDAFPHPALVVRERKYARSKEQTIQGPDILLLDPRDSRPILIEAKATRSKVRTAPDPTAFLMRSNYGEAFNALAPNKAGQKIEDLRRNLKEYQDIQAQIDQATGRPLVIALVQDMPPRSGRLLGHHLRRFPNDPLHNAPYDVLLMDLIELEMAVHHAKTANISLRTVLDVEVRGVAYELDPDSMELPLHGDLPERDEDVPVYCMRHPQVFR